MGLNVLLDVETKYAMAMSKSIYGADVLIHDAEEFPQASLTSAVVQPGQEVSIAVVPSVISSRASIRSIPVIERQCYFADEEKLRATRKYSLNSCLAECRVDFILSKCHCLPFFYPEIPSVENKDRQCGLSDVGCLRMYRSECKCAVFVASFLIAILHPPLRFHSDFLQHAATGRNAGF